MGDSHAMGALNWRAFAEAARILAGWLGAAARAVALPQR